MDLTTFLIRITICFALSILIGLERQLRHRMVGLRTNVLVCIGAFLFVYLSFGANIVNSDTTRIAAQVVSGIGFLGAGVILRDGSKIKGLNTAATCCSNWYFMCRRTCCRSYYRNGIRSFVKRYFKISFTIYNEQIKSDRKRKIHN